MHPVHRLSTGSGLALNNDHTLPPFVIRGICSVPTTVGILVPVPICVKRHLYHDLEIVFHTQGLYHYNIDKGTIES